MKKKLVQIHPGHTGRPFWPKKSDFHVFWPFRRGTGCHNEIFFISNWRWDIISYFCMKKKLDTISPRSHGETILTAKNWFFRSFSYFGHKKIVTMQFFHLKLMIKCLCLFLHEKSLVPIHPGHTGRPFWPPKGDFSGILAISGRKSLS